MNTRYLQFACLLVMLGPLLLTGLADTIKGASSIKFDANNDSSYDLTINGNGLGIGTTSPSSNLHISGGNAFVTGSVGIGTTNPRSSLHYSGTIGFSLQSASSNVTASNNSVLLVDSSSQNVTVTLPAATSVTGRVYYVKKTSNTNSVYVTSSTNIDGSSNILMTGASNGYPCLSVISNGTTWSIVSSGNATAVSETSWAPTSLSNCILWLDASDSATVTLNAGNVSQWNDKSGQTNHFTQGTAGYQPLYVTAGQNGLNVIRFDGSDDQLSKSKDWGTTQDIYVVTKYVSVPGGSGTVVFSGSYIHESNLYTASGGGTTYMYAGANYAFDVYSVGTTYHTYRSYISGSSLILGIDSRTETTGTSATDYLNTILNLGGITSYWANCEIAEMVIYSSKLSDADRNTLRSYFTTRWGL